ncbi:AAA domain-containing protein, putative AbiEii toxin, Type IV TA system [Streptomyces sp. 136MFCol5.1]|uniref:AAA family ATPase n=1 Tax=Streptomyces sp. 136MFCol5.1 TaxID=1172182 RepID=UPI0008804951|nr:AAA family ATPase [Streptomyces sp. 136MFCol5.1]SCZ08878.1 AAA domain-containing protein, putative AbiEii toxin, Type IV TA system [Streptomyces sp. 136MFCol5.1]
MPDAPHASIRLWKSMENFQPEVYVKHVAFGEGSPYEGQSVQLAPVTLVAGAHGSGKTTFLSLVAECLRAHARYYETPPIIGLGANGEIFLGGRCLLRVQHRGREIEVDADLGVSRKDARSEEKAENAFHPIIRGTYEVSTDIQIFFQDVRINSITRDLVDEPWVQKKRDLDALRDILGFSYDEATYYPLDVDGSGVEFPFVRAKRDGEWIDSYRMSYGELTVHKLRWEVANAPAESVLFLDEPEANIAPRGRAPLIDEIAALARATKRQVIIATHSAEFLRRVPLSAIRMCVRAGRSSAILTPSRASDLRDSLGVDHPLRFFLVVEDETAEASLGIILTTHQFHLISETEIIVAGSWNDVIVTHASLSSSSRVRSVAVIDGDQRDKVPAIKRANNVLFLPGSEPPEKVFIQFAARLPEEFARRLDCSISSINVYIAEMLGIDHHGWLKLLAKRTGHDWRHCLRAAFEIWHSSPENRMQANTLVEEIGRALRRGHE